MPKTRLPRFIFKFGAIVFGLALPFFPKGIYIALVNSNVARPRKLQAYVWPALLFLLSWIVYSNTLQHGYVWDDAIVITQNPRTQAGLEGIPAHFEFRDRVQLADFNGYRPVAMATHSLDIALWGQDPAAAHRMQVLYFSLLVLVVFFTLRSVFPGIHRSFAFVATLLFLVHPVHVEVVANLKSRDELLGLLFGLLALQAFVAFLRGGKWLPAVGSLGFILLAALSKENSLALPGFFVVLAWLLGSTGRERWRGGALVAGQVAFVLGAFWLLTGRLPGASPEENTLGFVENMVVGNSHAVEMGFFDRLLNSGHLFLLYLRNFFWPTELVYYSGYNHIPVLSGFSPLGLLGLLLMLGSPVYFGWLALRRKFPTLVFGFFLFYIPLLVYLNLLFLVPDTMADRFLFTPSLGLSWLMVLGLGHLMKLDFTVGLFAGFDMGGAEVLKKGRPPSKLLVDKGPSPKGLFLATFLFLGVIAFSGLTTQRNVIWKSNLALFEADLPALEDCGKAHYYLATTLLDLYQGQLPADPMAARGYPGAIPAELERAVREYRKAIAISPGLFYARLELGQLLGRMGRDAEALAVLEAAAAAFPDHADPHFNLGRAQYLSGKFEAALGSFERALALRPDDQGSMELLGRSFDQLKRYPEGIARMREYSRMYPENVSLLDALSDLEFNGGDPARAMADLQRCLDLDPQNSFFWKKLIGRYQLLEDDVNAALYYQRALERGILQPQ